MKVDESVVTFDVLIQCPFQVPANARTEEETKQFNTLFINTLFKKCMRTLHNVLSWLDSLKLTPEVVVVTGCGMYFTTSSTYNPVTCNLSQVHTDVTLMSDFV